MSNRQWWKLSRFAFDSYSFARFGKMLRMHCAGDPAQMCPSGAELVTLVISKKFSDLAAEPISRTPGVTRNEFGPVRIDSGTFGVRLRQAVSDVPRYARRFEE